jgi:hypothetical protein
MPIIFSDKRICEKCGKIFEWNYFELVRQNIDSPQFVPETMPHRLTLVNSCHQRDIGSYDIGVTCPHCDFDNCFTFEKK